ncbi:MAG: hypothetical protein ACTSO9_18130 [Candidatus Helarchaeota archaeon]
MSEESDEEVVNEFMANLKELTRKVSPFLGGIITGIIGPKIYELLSEDQKRKWKSIFPFHHGAAGLVITGVSLIFRSILQLFPDDNKYIKFSKKLTEIIMGVGSGLAIEDIKDYNKWFKAELY